MKHVIVGAGTAGFNAMTTLLELQPDAEITLVSQETPYARMVLPYFLSGEIAEDNVYTITAERLKDLGVEVRLERATDLDLAGSRLLLEGDHSLEFDDLLLATGSSAVRPPVPGLDGPRVYDHWTLADSQALKALIHPGAEVTLIGAGFIAFTLVNPLLHAGCRLTLIEREPRVLPRMLNAAAAEVLEGWLRDRGVTVLTGAELAAVEDAPGGRKRLNYRSEAGASASIEAESVIVATGIRPNIDWLRDSGLPIGQGVQVDSFLRAGRSQAGANVYAAGDIAEIANAVTGQRGIMAIETAAMEQGRLIGAAMAGRPREYAGGLAINVIEAARLQAASFGDWSGGEASEAYADGGHYRRYVWHGDRLAGAVIVGPARQVAGENDMGMLKGLVQAGQPLGEWRRLLEERPFEVRKAYLASRTAARLLPETLLGQPSRPLDAALAAAGAQS